MRGRNPRRQRSDRPGDGFTVAIQALGRIPLAFDVILAVVGGILVAAGKFDVLGGLPGDPVFRKSGVTVFAPVATILLMSLELTVLLSLPLRLFR